MAQDTPEKSILEKLAQTQTFHPAGAKLFVPDWTLDPGDVVTVTSKKDVHDPDEEPTEYRVPIYSMDLTWNGTSRLDIQSTGNQEREPLSALRRKEYQIGRRGYGMAKELDDSFKEFETWQTQTDEVIGIYAAQFVDILGDGTNEGRLTLAETAIEQTASDATITAQAAGILLDEDGHPILDERGKYQYDPNAADTTLTARINTNATNILSKVSQSDLNTTLASYLLINSFSTELASTLDNGDTTLAAKIITAVNKNTNTSSVNISADQINLTGYVTAIMLDVRMADVDQLFASTGYAGDLHLRGNGTLSGGNVDTGYVKAMTYYIGEDEAEVGRKTISVAGVDSGISFLGLGTNTSVAIPNAIATITVDDNPPAGKIGFKYTTFSNSTPVPINFNIADTQTYINGVSAAYTSGWQTAQGDVSLPTTQQTTNAYMDVVVPSSIVDDDPVQQRYTVSVDDEYAYIKTGNTIVAQIANTGGGGAPTVNDWMLTYQTGTDYTYKASVKVNGSLKESGDLSALDAYNNGWTGAYQSVGIFPTAVADLVPGGSPITIYAQAKATSGSAKSNVASVQVKARALNLKNEIFSANDTYTVPEGYDGYGTVTVNVHDGGGGGDYYATFLDNITLESTDIGNSVTKYSIANYSDGHRDPAANTRVVIDASKVYNAGVTAGLGGVVDVVKGNWSYGRCNFTPSAGNGQSQEVSLSYSLVKPGFYSTSDETTINILDGSSSVGLPLNLVICRLRYDTYNYACLYKDGDALNKSNILAKFRIDGSDVISDVASILQNGKITYEDADKKIADIPVTAYDADDNALMSTTVTADMSDTWDAGYEAGYTQGTGVTILDQYSTTIDSNNTTITLLPSDKGNYNVMASAKVNVQVPTVYRIAQNLAQTIVLPASHKGTAAITNNQVEYDIGPDTGNFSVVIDASKVWQAGFDEGVGAEFAPTTVTVQGLGPYTVTPILSNSGVSFNRYGYDKLYYYDDDLEKYVECTSRARYWFYTTSDATGGSYYRAGNDISYYRQGYTAQYYVRTE